MWDGITYVDPTSKPPIYEGIVPAHVTVINAGPGNVDLSVWEDYGRDLGAPKITMRLYPGNSRSASGRMIILAFSEDQRGAVEVPLQEARQAAGGRPEFAAVGWRIAP